jgi:hypothetical protein
VGAPAHTSHLPAPSGTQHPTDRLIGHAIITRDVTERFPLLDPLEHSFPYRGRDLEAEDQVQLEGGQAETEASDCQGQR